MYDEIYRGADAALLPLGVGGQSLLVDMVDPDKPSHSCAQDEWCLILGCTSRGYSFVVEND